MAIGSKKFEKSAPPSFATEKMADFAKVNVRNVTGMEGRGARNGSGRNNKQHTVKQDGEGALGNEVLLCDGK